MHLQKVKALKKEFNKHQQQILFREKHLKNYNFLKYNLSQSLRAQKNIL